MLTLAKVLKKRSNYKKSLFNDNDYKDLLGQYKRIPPYKHYYISKTGTVITTKYGFIQIISGTQKSARGYNQIGLTENGRTRSYRISQLVMMAFKGHIPKGYKIVVDHIDNDKQNDTLGNLQLISNRKNSTKDRKNGTSSYTGVYFFKARMKWRSETTYKKKKYHLGLYKSELKAFKTYQKAIKIIESNLAIQDTIIQLKNIKNVHRDTNNHSPDTRIRYPL